MGLVWFGLEGSEFRTMNEVEEVMELKVEEVMELKVEEVMELVTRVGIELLGQLKTYSNKSHR